MKGGTGFCETGWGKLEAAKKVTWAQLSKHWIALSITIQSMSTWEKNCAIQWIVSYLVDGVILHVNNQGWLHFLRCPQPCHVVTNKCTVPQSSFLPVYLWVSGEEGICTFCDPRINLFPTSIGQG